MQTDIKTKRVNESKLSSCKGDYEMPLLEEMTRRVKKFDIIDVKLAQVVVMFLALIIAKLIPEVMDINIRWFVVLLIICAIKPFYVFWFKA
jgi:hypothetical protein